jgi:hypothetical protein
MKILFNFLILFVFSQTWSQSTTNQPASYYGLGESSAQNHGIFDALGKNTINVFDSTILNFYNPAKQGSGDKFDSLTVGTPAAQSDDKKKKKKKRTIQTFMDFSKAMKMLQEK